MPRDPEALKQWYLKAMLQRIEELRGLRDRLVTSTGGAYDAARKVGQALRGSGATFGFPQVTAVATLVETAADGEVLRRVEGLIHELGVLTRDQRDGRLIPPEWLALAAGLDDPSVLDDAPDIGGAWGAAASSAGIDASELAARVASYLNVEVADLEAINRGALRLVPEALVSSGKVVPLREDSLTITVATAEPTNLRTELDLERLTGRKPILVVAPPAALDAVIGDLYGEVSTRTRPSPPARRASEETVGAAPGDTSRAAAPAPATTGPAARPASASPETTAPAERAAERVPRGSSPRDSRGVLVVDDEASARLFVRALLEKRGFHVAEASDGLEALNVVRVDREIDLVVADLNMPRMDGLELMWELRDERTSAHLPVIVVTGEMDEILETQLLEEGADDYIRKPVDPRLFLARVEATIRRAAD